MYKYMAWDSKHFGMKVYRWDGAPDDGEPEDFDVIYGMASADSYKQIRRMEECGYRLIQNRIDFSQRLNREIPISLISLTKDHLVLKKASIADPVLAEIRDIGRSLSLYSRFSMDDGFSKLRAHEMYDIWIENAFGDETSELYFVSGFENKKSRVLGFCTVKYSEDTGRIGLFAVAERLKAQGIGSLLMNRVLLDSNEKRIKSIHVATQSSNIAAMNFYYKCGFKVDTSEIIMHKWRRNDSV